MKTFSIDAIPAASRVLATVALRPLKAALVLMVLAGASSLGLAAPQQQQTPAQNAASSIIDVTRVDGRSVRQPLLPNVPAQARENTRRIAQIMRVLPVGAAVYFPAGTYYFYGAALPNRGTIETSNAGQVIYGAGAGVTRLIQTDLRKDFGFVAKANFKRVPTATVRVRHKGCAVRGLSVLLDPTAPPDRITPSAAIQIAHIKYFPDNNIGIVETTGQGVDFLLDFVVVEDVTIGENHGSGVLADRFFEVGVDIVGTGGQVRVLRVHRLDARIGVRLDNGNHCGQGDYQFENIYMIGKPGVTQGGVFFDWVGGQAPTIRNCSSGFTSGLHAGPLGVDGDRFEPNAEGEVVRRPDKTWDWLTWHNHIVPDNPNHAERTTWYGLPRQVSKVVRIGSEPRTGGIEWKEGADYTLETVREAGDLQGATRIRWKNGGPSPGSVYYVTFQQPMEYRVHDLQWGNAINCAMQEAIAIRPDMYAMKFEDSGYGRLNPDFDFSVGYGFTVSHSFILGGDIILNGKVGYMNFNNMTTGFCKIRIDGASEERPATRLPFFGNKSNDILIGDYVRQIKLDNNEVLGQIAVNAPHSAQAITIKGSDVFFGGAGGGIELRGSVRDARVEDNDVQAPGASGDGIRLLGVRDASVTGNRVFGCGGAAIRVEKSGGLIVSQNIVRDNGDGILLDFSAEGGRSVVRGNISRSNKGKNFEMTATAKTSPVVADNVYDERG